MRSACWLFTGAAAQHPGPPSYARALHTCGVLLYQPKKAAPSGRLAHQLQDSPC